jgi:hypothetical protein
MDANHRSDALFDAFDAAEPTLRLRGEEDVGVRFPPGLGLIPPRDLPRQPRARAE